MASGGERYVQQDYAELREEPEELLSQVADDLDSPLKFYLGELCTKTIWDECRPKYAISQGQRKLPADPLVEYVPLPCQVEIEPRRSALPLRNPGQLQHGENYANAYLEPLENWMPECES